MMLKGRRGFALAMVLGIVVALLIFVSAIFFRTRAQRDTHGMLSSQAKALTAARGIMQLALYKFRVLPTEFYFLASATRMLSPIVSKPYLDAWMNDLQSNVPNSLAAQLADSLKQTDGGNYQVGVASFVLLNREDDGYRKDFVRIEAWGQYEEQKKVIEELLEVEVTHD